MLSIAAQDPAAQPGKPRVFYTAADWHPYLAPLLATAAEPPAFAAKWLTIESDFQPCAVGNVFASFVWPKDGKRYPLEAGLAQLYGPDDYSLLGVEPSAFRAYAAPDYLATWIDAKGMTHSGIAHSQVCVRALTPDEMHVQAKSVVDKITTARHAADRLLSSVGAVWSPTSADYWAFVKLQHALPGLAKAIGYVRADLGRAPMSWVEFSATVLSRAVLDQIKAHDPNTWNHSAGFANDLHNAWETGAVVSGPPVA